jgi:hypothetical protein
MPPNSSDKPPDDGARPGNPPPAGCPHMSEWSRDSHQSPPTADSPADATQSAAPSATQSAAQSAEQSTRLAAPAASLIPVLAGPVAIPVALAHLPVVGGMAVPWITPRLPDGRHLLGVVDAGRQRQALLQGLCGVCGRAHERRMVALARPRDLARQLVAEPPLHPVCARYTTQACPAVGGRMQHYRSTPRPLPDPVAVPGGIGYYVVEDQEQAASRRGAPADRWFAVWLSGYDTVWDPNTRTLSASWQAHEPLRIRPVATGDADTAS